MGVHVPPEQVFTLNRNGCSPWAGICTQDHTYQNPLDGLYLARAPGNIALETLVDTDSPGQLLDPDAPAGSTVTAIGLERDGFRGSWLAISASMEEAGSEEDASMAGIYVTRLP
jgi:hypothetical protein